MIIFTIEALCVIVLCLILVAIIFDDRKNRNHAMRLIKLKGYWDGGERRSTERLNISLPIRYGAGGNITVSKSADLSERGVRLLLEERLEIGAPLTLEIQLPNVSRPVKATGEVAWVQEALEDKKAPAKRLFNTGIRLRKFHNSDGEKLFEFIHSL